MGNTTCCVSSCNCSTSATCNCFVNDRLIKDIDVLRHYTSTWIWSNDHDTALEQTLSHLTHDIPKDIMYLIKDYSWNDSQQHQIIDAKISSEKCYTNPEELLRKQLCSRWYRNISSFQTENFQIAIYGSTENTQQIFDAVHQDTCTLPALQSNTSVFTEYQQIYKTVHIDECQIRVDLNILATDDDNYSMFDDATVNIIVLNEYDSLQRTNIICNALWKRYISMRNCVIVKIKNGKKISNLSQTIDAYASQWNVPCVSLCLNDDRSVMDLFDFCVKYHWFCSVC